MSSERRSLSIVLRAGVVISFSLLAVGLVLSVGRPAPEILTPSSLRSLGPGIVRGESAALIHLGLLALMLTPFSRVVVLLIQFSRGREVPFLVATIGVLFLLIGTVVARLL